VATDRTYQEVTVTNGHPDKVLLTAAGPHMAPVLEYTEPTFKEFAAAFGYRLEVERIVDGPDLSREARWNKLSLIRHHLQSGADLVLWIDADAIILRPHDEDIAAHLRPTDFQGFVLEIVPVRDRLNPNSGVWLIRRGDLALEFLDEVQKAGLQPTSLRWADQDAIMRVLGWDVGGERYTGARPRGDGGKFFQQTGWLPTSWNTLYSDERPRLAHRQGMHQVNRPHILHLAGLTVADRLEILRGLQSKLAGGDSHSG
jgi:hypothetical protein